MRCDARYVTDKAVEKLAEALRQAESVTVPFKAFLRVEKLTQPPRPTPLGQD